MGRSPRGLLEIHQGETASESGLQRHAHFQIWIMRNGHLHDDKTQGPHSYKRYQLLHTLRHLYRQQAQMLSADRAIFNRDLAAWEHQSTLLDPTIYPICATNSPTQHTERTRHEQPYLRSTWPSPFQTRLEVAEFSWLCWFQHQRQLLTSRNFPQVVV